MRSIPSTGSIAAEVFADLAAQAILPNRNRFAASGETVLHGVCLATAIAARLRSLSSAGTARSASPTAVLDWVC